MLLLTPLAACFVCVPKTGSQAISAHLEAHARQERDYELHSYDVESLHDWHASLEETEASGLLPYSVYDLWSFAVVRNPYDRLVSYCAAEDPEFAHAPRYSLHQHLDLLEQGVAPRWLWPQVHFTAGVKTLYRFEDLATAARDINTRLGIAPDVPLPVLNESSRERYPVYYDSELRARVAELYRQDLHAFDYRF